MAPLPENNTNRLFVDYLTKGQQHSILFRGQPGIGVVPLYTIAREFCLQALPICYSTTDFIGARYSQAGSAFSLPIGWAPMTGTFAAAQPDERLPNFIGFSGRGSTTGRETNIRLFGTTQGPDGTFRVEPPIGLALDAIRDVLVDASGELATIGADPVFWRGYVNVGIDAYYQRKARTG